MYVTCLLGIDNIMHSQQRFSYYMGQPPVATTPLDCVSVVVLIEVASLVVIVIVIVKVVILIVIVIVIVIVVVIVIVI